MPTWRSEGLLKLYGELLGPVGRLTSSVMRTVRPRGTTSVSPMRALADPGRPTTSAVYVSSPEIKSPLIEYELPLRTASTMTCGRNVVPAGGRGMYSFWYSPG